MGVTVYDIADRANVSQTTVSRVLNRRDDGFISEATKQRVLVAAREMGYRPNRLAKALASGITHTIGMMSPHSYFNFEIAHGAEIEAGSNGYRVIRGCANIDYQTETHQIELLLEHCIDGIILVGLGRPEHAGRYLDLIDEARIPCVTLDEETFADRVDTVVSDDVHGARTAVEHLLSLGHTRIAHLSAKEQGLSTGRNRHAGYELALLNAGIEIDESLIACGHFDHTRAAEGMLKLLDLPNPPTAVFAASDYMASRAMLAARKRGVRMPEDIALVGYGNTEISDFIAMTTVNQHTEEMGRLAFLRLLQRLKEPELEPEVIRVETSLIVRETCGAAIRGRQDEPELVTS
jgi:DNA-binding LacI/PurR family transcriptional regulator